MSYSVKTIYLNIIDKLNKEEKNHVQYLIKNQNSLYAYNVGDSENFLCLNIQIKDKRKDDFYNILDGLNLKYKVIGENKYFAIIEINENLNYIYLEFVVNSHVIIPCSFLKHFSIKDSDDCKIVYYIDMKTLKIEKEKIKKYGTQYGYYSKQIEEYLSDFFEAKIGKITAILKDFTTKKIKNFEFSQENLNTIYDFFNITLIRNPKFLRGVNDRSICSKIFGGLNHNDLIYFSQKKRLKICFWILKLIL